MTHAYEWTDERDGERFAIDADGCLYNSGPEGWEMTGAVPRAGRELVRRANAIARAIEHMEAAWPGVTTRPASLCGSPLERLAAILLGKES